MSQHKNLLAKHPVISHDGLVVRECDTLRTTRFILFATIKPYMHAEFSSELVILGLGIFYRIERKYIVYNGK